MNTFLFDLDGTLLPMDMKLFEKLYFQGMAGIFHDLVDPKELVSLIWASTKEMISNTEYRTNEEVFMTDFGKRIKGDLAIYQERFNKYYDTAYHSVKESTREVQSMRDSIKLLKEKGYSIVIATNPLFPKAAIHTRIRWAGFEPEEFDYISTFETNHYCKPQLKYYEEVLKDINKKPEECMMVGNDVQEDLIAKTLGVRTYLIIDNMLHRTEGDIVTDYKGTYEDFYDFVKRLPAAED
jgi:FMN phosphatase YigB (HAD superfamily)